PAPAPSEPGPVPAPVPLPAPAPSATPTPSPVPAPVVPQQRTPAPAPLPEVVSALQGHSPAFLALAQLGRIDSRLALSAADCAVLEELAAAWLAQGVDADYLVRTLTAGLPAAVDSPVGFVRRRLRDKIPPQLPAAPTPGPSVRRLMVECTQCGVPGRPEALPDGLCRSCRTTAPDVATEPTAARDVTAHVGALRELLRLP
ncbi:MarR family transcriptional regulator, partial [Streptomyces sp. NPDC060035]